jgi:hypothetical protein
MIANMPIGKSVIDLAVSRQSAIMWELWPLPPFQGFGNTGINHKEIEGALLH